MEKLEWKVIRLANDYNDEMRRYFTANVDGEVLVMGMSGIKSKNRDIMEANKELDHHMQPCDVLDIPTYVQPGVVKRISRSEFNSRRIRKYGRRTGFYPELPRDVDDETLTNLMIGWEKKGLPINSPFTHVSQWVH